MCLRIKDQAVSGNFTLSIRNLTILFSISFLVISCFPASDSHREEGKIFHACIPGNGAAGGLYFVLYNDHKYQICSTGGIGQDCYSGTYILRKDTLTLINLSKDIHLKSNKLLISHYSATDNLGNLGEIHQLDPETNQTLGKNETHFVIRLDSLKNNR